MQTLCSVQNSGRCLADWYVCKETQRNTDIQSNRSPLGNCKVTVIYRVTAIIIQVNLAENIRKLKILGSCPVTAIIIVDRYIQV